ncbi:coiled-coil protein [Thalictrum thalictroides]|uniref:Coiled-coil protein n=1 Tax=Thalictrum thalictroides TaxID=46969 RepID=A0A7J6VPZ7_THATH|nr:coiled-coil protein [Thalictrum thalictroides]
MSFIAGRLAATEGAFFLQESKHAVDRMVQKKKKNNNFPSSTTSSPITCQVDGEGELQADILHEVLRHSLPSKILQPPSDSSLSVTSKWVLPHDPNNKVYSLSPDALNPIRAYVSLPQVSFGPKRWKLPEGDNPFIASTANDLRLDRYTTHANSDRLKAASEIGKPYIIATTTVFGAAALMFGLSISKLDVSNKADIKTKGRDLLKPKLEILREQLIPLQIWVKTVSKKWHYEREELVDKGFIKEISKRLGAK